MVQDIQLQFDLMEDEEHVLYTVWDLAGQSVFYDMLHLLMTRSVKLPSFSSFSCCSLCFFSNVQIRDLSRVLQYEQTD